MVLYGGDVRRLRNVNTMTFCLWLDSDMQTSAYSTQKNNLHKEGTQTGTKLLQSQLTSNFQDPR
jgi:hypothetical protein